jgi:hypothetical protein
VKIANTNHSGHRRRRLLVKVGWTSCQRLDGGASWFSPSRALRRASSSGGSRAFGIRT